MIEIRVKPHPNNPQGPFDLLIACLGYETRSLHLAKLYTGAATKKLAIAFQDRLVGQYDRNKVFYVSNDFQIASFNAQGFLEDLQAVFGELRSAERAARVLIDISSMSRPMIATVVLALAEACKNRSIDVVFSYCPALFTRPSDLRQPVTVSQPVIPEFAGWSNQPDKPVAAVAGLGFEFDQALGAIEFLEPAVAWTFIPFGEDVQYDRAVQNANKELLTALTPDKIIRYNVANPFQCFAELEALTYGLLDTSRPIIIPFGPKIFLCCLFLSLRYTRLT